MNDQTTKRSALIVAASSSFVTPMSLSSVPLALPAIGKELGMSAVGLSWVATIFLMATAMFLLPAGRLADIRGRKKMFIAGMAVFTVGSAFCSLAPGSWSLLLARAIQGMGCSMIFSTGMAILTSVFPVGERGQALGVQVASVYTGMSIGPFIGGVITHFLGWRWVFVFPIPLALFTMAIAIWLLKGEWADARGERLDLVGAAIFALSILVLIPGSSDLPHLRGFILGAAGLAGLVFFVIWEQRCDQPVFEMRLFSENRIFAFSGLAALINYGATFAIAFLLSLYLQQVKGLPADTAGLVLVVQPVVMAVLSPLTGRLSDRVQPRILASVGMGLTALGLFMLAFLHSDTSMTFFIACLLLVGAGFGIFSSPNMNSIMSSVQKKHYGIASGAVAMMRLLGQMFSMAIASSVLAVIMGQVMLGPEHKELLMHSIQVCFYIFTGLCAAGIFASLARGRIQR